MRSISDTFNNIVTGLQNIDRDGFLLSLTAFTAAPLQPASLAAGAFLLTSLLAASNETGKALSAPAPAV